MPSTSTPILNPSFQTPSPNNSGQNDSEAVKDTKDLLQAWELLVGFGGEEVKNQLDTFGVGKAEDLAELDETDLLSIAAVMKKVHRKKFMRFLDLTGSFDDNFSSCMVDDRD